MSAEHGKARALISATIYRNKTGSEELSLRENYVGE